MALADLCRGIELILTDVDGVMTDGGIVYDNDGVETKRFHVRDGFGVKLWRRGGGRFGVVTARTSHVVQLRAGEIGADYVRQGVELKLAVVREIVSQTGLEMQQTCFIGDDLPDLACIRAAGLGVAVADATDELRQAADYVTSARGGRGAVRETIELVLKAQRRWDELIKKYEA
jgi:YrbI family 3-deoxy-D-manno-octulosonate 8-phosphate phosphatase